MTVSGLRRGTQNPRRPSARPVTGVPSVGPVLRQRRGHADQAVLDGTLPGHVVRRLRDRARAPARRRRGCAAARRAARARPAPRTGRPRPRRAAAPSGRVTRDAPSGRRAAAARNRLKRSTQPRAGRGRRSVASVRSHSMPNDPNSAVAARKSRVRVRPVVCEVGEETCAPTYSGATSWLVQRWICWRARASVMSEAQTRCTRSSTPRSTRPPPDAHDSQSIVGCAARRSSSSA